MADTEYLALLRGINVGGNNIIKMADLKACFENMGFSDVATFIQSGNVLFKSAEKDKNKLTNKIEKRLSERFNYKSRIVVVTHKELEKIVEGVPRGFGRDVDKFRYDVIFLKEPLTPKDAMKNVSTKEGVDNAYTGKYVLYFSRLISKATQSHLTKIITLPMYQNMTIRNWNTTTKLLALMGKGNEKNSEQSPVTAKKKAADEPADVRANQFIEQLETYRSPEAAKAHNHLASDGEDVIMGVRMGQVFALAKEFIEMPPGEIEKLLESPIHEVRVGAVSVMDWQARSKKTPEERRKELFELYIGRHDRINSWDLVDRSAIYVVGSYLFDKPRKILYKLARSKDTWERRTAIVSTLHFIGKGDVDDSFKIAEILLRDKEDLIHKATGWALRYAGDKNRERLLHFLDKYAATMPRTALRYAIEHLDKEQREHYLGLKGKASK